MARQATIDAFADPKANFDKAEVKGEEEFDGKPAYVVELTPKGGGAPQTVMFDKESGLIAGTKSTGADGMEVTAKFGDYKEVGGVKMAHSIMNEGGMMNVTITFETIENNPEIPADKFALPAEIKALKDAPAAPAQ
jgi:outer membrane lipoprotein-sorting protein